MNSPSEDLSRAEQQLRVSTLELFFDLGFVFTLTQLTALLARELSLLGVAQVVLIFVVLFWMYGGYAWLTNQVPPLGTTRRLLLVAASALLGYFYAFVPMLLGIISLAAGVKLTIGNLGVRLPTGSALVLAGGVALYLAGNGIFRWALRIPGPADRGAAALIVLATAFLGIRVSGLAELIGLVITLVAMLALEAKWRTPRQATG